MDSLKGQMHSSVPVSGFSGIFFFLLLKDMTVRPCSDAVGQYLRCTTPVFWLIVLQHSSCWCKIIFYICETVISLALFLYIKLMKLEQIKFVFCDRVLGTKCLKLTTILCLSVYLHTRTGRPWGCLILSHLNNQLRPSPKKSLYST